jgi:FMN phosphatase YigB (HAD superfamily)
MKTELTYQDGFDILEWMGVCEEAMYWYDLLEVDSLEEAYERVDDVFWLSWLYQQLNITWKRAAELCPEFVEVIDDISDLQEQHGEEYNESLRLQDRGEITAPQADHLRIVAREAYLDELAKLEGRFEDDPVRIPWEHIQPLLEEVFYAIDS